MTTTNKPGTLFWIVAVIALLWNLMGTFQFLFTTFMAEEFRESFDEEHLSLMDNLPSWYAILFGIAVFAGLLGSLLLLLRKKFAVPVFLISLIAVLIQMGYWLFVTDSMEVLGAEAVIMPMIVIIIAIFLYYFSKGAAQRKWLR